MFGSRKELQRELRKLDSGAEIAVRLTIGGIASQYLVIREDTFRELVSEAGHELVKR